MGVGFAVYVGSGEVDAFLNVARETGYDAWRAGAVTKQGARKAVEIAPLGITFQGESLQVR
jgi:phosphoribosylaminoimidazole (AIR) synthetase